MLPDVILRRFVLYNSVSVVDLSVCWLKKSNILLCCFKGCRAVFISLVLPWLLLKSCRCVASQAVVLVVVFSKRVLCCVDVP